MRAGRGAAFKIPLACGEWSQLESILSLRQMVALGAQPASGELCFDDCNALLILSTKQHAQDPEAHNPAKCWSLLITLEITLQQTSVSFYCISELRVQWRKAGRGDLALEMVPWRAFERLALLWCWAAKARV